VASSGKWEPVLQLSDRRWLGVKDGQWAIGEPDHDATPATNPLGMIVLLQRRDWPTAEQELAEAHARHPELPYPPIHASVRLALTKGTSTYWAERALQWLSDGYPADDLKAEIVALRSDKSYSQRARHQAARLLKSL
jgi:hypothetical protein